MGKARCHELSYRRLTDPDQAERWWAGTFAAHQGEHDVEPLHEAARFLATAGCLRATTGEGRTGDSGADGSRTDEGRLEPTALGRLTSRFMVDATLADELATAVREAPVPENAFAAEQLLAALLSTRLPVLEQAPFTERARAALRRVLREADHGAGETGALEGTGAAQETGAPAETGVPEGDEPKPEAGDLARAVLLLVAGRPRLFGGRPGYVLGIPVDSMTGILEEARRYLAWLGAQGPIGTVHPWAAVVAGDLALRIRWRALGPGRGAGRLLWMCERMATAPHAPRLVPRMWQAARARGIDAPDWTGTTPPGDCALTPDRYLTLLAERATGVRLDLREGEGGVRVAAPPGSVIRLWKGATTTLHIGDGIGDGEETMLLLPPGGPAGGVSGGLSHGPSYASADNSGAAVFTRGGDRVGTGWLGAYAAIRL